MTWMQEPLSPGHIVHGRYTLEAVIGVGGMGAVYRARHNKVGRILAIKVLHSHMARNPVMVERFHREARAAGSIGHDNICEVTDIGATEDGLSYLVMPYVKGLPYSDVLVGEDLSLRRVVDIFVQILNGLDAAHKAQIIHRDLKPDNVLITQVGNRQDFVKLLDFGISKILTDDEGSSGLTRTGLVLGTPHYMAPEQARGSKTVDERVDIYAVGIMLYETLTGKRPYQGDSWNEVMYNILNEPFPIPAALNPNVPAELNRIVLKALARDTAARYPSASSMAEELETLLEQAPDPKQIVSIRRPPKKRQLDPMTLFTTKAEFHRRSSTTAGDESEVWSSDTDAGDAALKAEEGTSGTTARRRWLMATLGLILVTVCAVAVRAFLTAPPAVPVSATVPTTEAQIATESLAIELSPQMPAATVNPNEPSEEPRTTLPSEAIPAPQKNTQEPRTAKRSGSRSDPKRKRRRPSKTQAQPSKESEKQVIEGWSGSVFYTEY